jgi:hypothetical protein
MPEPPLEPVDPVQRQAAIDDIINDLDVVTRFNLIDVDPDDKETLDSYFEGGMSEFTALQWMNNSREESPRTWTLKMITAMRKILEVERGCPYPQFEN